MALRETQRGQLTFANRYWRFTCPAISDYPPLSRSNEAACAADPTRGILRSDAPQFNFYFAYSGYNKKSFQIYDL
jgi:hypothetical protein